MDTLCGIGLPELLLLALLAFVLIGPERSKSVALTAGRWLSRMMRSGWWKEFMQVTAALRDLPTTLVRMAELEETQAELRRTIRDLEQGAEIDFNAAGPTSSARQPAASEDPWGIAAPSARGRTPPPPAPSTPPEDGAAR